jgi:hypothetical protein
MQEGLRSVAMKVRREMRPPLPGPSDLRVKFGGIEVLLQSIEAVIRLKVDLLPARRFIRQS